EARWARLEPAASQGTREGARLHRQHRRLRDDEHLAAQGSDEEARGQRRQGAGVASVRVSVAAVVEVARVLHPDGAPRASVLEAEERPVFEVRLGGEGEAEGFVEDTEGWGLRAS